jgi:hypothetical protein
MIVHKTQIPSQCAQTLSVVTDLVENLGGSLEDFHCLKFQLSVPLPPPPPSVCILDLLFPYPDEWRAADRPENFLMTFCDRLIPAAQRVDATCDEEQLQLGFEIDRFLGSCWDPRRCQRLWHFQGNLLYVDRACSGSRDFEYIRTCVEAYVLERNDLYQRLVKKVDRLRKFSESKTEPQRGYIEDHVLAFVLARDGERCGKCGSTEKLQFDHILPVSRGGNDEPENLRVLCRACNIQRGNLS